MLRSNYRPISLLQIFNILPEKLVYRHLTTLLNPLRYYQIVNSPFHSSCELNKLLHETEAKVAMAQLKELKKIDILKSFFLMIIISTFPTVPGQPLPRFHVEAWLPFRKCEMDYSAFAPNIPPSTQFFLSSIKYKDLAIERCNYTLGFFVDLKKAFGTVDHKNKLFRSEIPIQIFSPLLVEYKALSLDLYSSLYL